MTPLATPPLSVRRASGFVLTGCPDIFVTGQEEERKSEPKLTRCRLHVQVTRSKFKHHYLAGASEESTNGPHKWACPAATSRERRAPLLSWHPPMTTVLFLCYFLMVKPARLSWELVPATLVAVTMTINGFWETAADSPTFRVSAQWPDPCHRA